MWDRQFKKAKCDGLAVNILSTERKGGNRVQIDEIPYADEYHTDDSFGTKSKPYSFTFVFVGASSLDDSNGFIDRLENKKSVWLDHPDLGELNLIALDFTQSLTTVRGRVDVTVDFVKKGIQSELIASIIKTIKGLTSPVEFELANNFAREMLVAKSDIQAALKSEVVQLLSLAELIAPPNTQRIDKNAIITQAILSPLETAQQTQAAINTAIDAITITVKKDETNTQRQKPSDAKAIATNAFKKLERSASSTFIKTHCLLGRLKVSDKLEAVTAITNEKDLTLSIKQHGTATMVTSRLFDSTATLRELRQSAQNQKRALQASPASHENFKLIKAMENLTTELVAQEQKANRILLAFANRPVPVEAPALWIAHHSETPRPVFESINNQPHPLFVKGQAKVLNG